MLLFVAFCVVVDANVVVDAFEFVAAIICDDKSRLFVDWSKQLGNDNDNWDCDCWFCWTWGRIVNDGVVVIVVEGETFDGLGFNTESDVVDWRILVEPLTSGTVGILLVSSCVSQITERSTSHDKSAVELHKRLA